MATLQYEIPNFNELFLATKNPVVLNNIPYLTKEDRKKFTEMLLTTYDTDVLSTVPQCACESLTGGDNLGKTCNYCNTVVTYPSESDIELKTWIRAPDEVEGFILPVVYYQLCNIISSTGFNVLEYWLNTRIKLPTKLGKPVLAKLAALENAGLQRGLNNFIRDIDKFIDVLAVIGGPKASDYCLLLLANKDKLFPRYLPMPAKAMLIVENTQLGNYADNNSITGAIDAARTIVSLSVPRQRPSTIGSIENKIVSVISNLKQYYTAMIKDSFCPKKGWLRGQVYSSRSHFCARAVITSISEPHHYQECHIPWSVSLELLKVHIISKLLHKYNFNEKNAHDLVEANGNIFIPLLYEIMLELIDEAPKITYSTKEDLEYYKLMGYTEDQVKKLKRPVSGVGMICQRNPSLDELSCQLVYFTKVKTDLNDKTVSVSVLTLKGYNADFDGDSPFCI